MISISKIMVPLQFSGFLLYVVKLAQVLVTYMKHLQGAKMQSTVLEVQRIISQSEVDLYISITLTIFPRR